MKDLTINGVQCLMETDENGFIDIHLNEPPKKYEWIVRGALDEESALTLAADRIKLRKQGYMLMHDKEGRVSYYKLAELEGRIVYVPPAELT